MTAFMLIWVDFAYTARLSSQTEVALLWIKISWAVTIPLFCSLYFFVVYFLDEEKKYKTLNLLVFLIGVIFYVVTLFSDLIMKGVSSQRVWTKLIYGDYVVVFYGAVLFLSSLSLFFLSKKYYSSKRGDKLRIQYFFIGIVFFLFMNVVFNIIYPFIFGISNYYQLGDYSTVVSMIFIAYAITRRNLMGIKSFLTQTLVVLISVILLFDVFFLSNGVSSQILKLLVLLTFLYFSKELIKSVKKEKESKEEIEKVNLNLEERNKDLHTLLDASGKVSQNLDSKKISQDIVNSVPENLKYLGYNIGVIFLYNVRKDCLYVYSVTDSLLTRRIKEKTKVDVRKFHEHLSSSDDLIVKTINDKEVYISDKMEDFFGGFINKEKNNAVQKLIRAKSFVSIPLFSSGQVMGVIIFSNEKKLNNITERSKNIVQAFASHIGSAIENAQLYEKTNRQMSELGALNRDLKKANIRLKELLEMKNEFLHITSHQLRTPLTSIRGMISMWIDGDFDKLPKAQKDEMLRRIYISTERLNNITNDMLDALELEGGVMKLKFKNISIIEMIKDTIATLQSDYDSKGIYLKMGEVDADIPDIEAEPNYLAQIFMNLIDNSCKYTISGGTTIDIKKAGEYVDVYIKDTGIGMESSEIKRAFEKFTRGKNAMKENASGSGLGLFIAKKILDEHNGKIVVKSDGLNKGTTFKISLPIKQ